MAISISGRAAEELVYGEDDMTTINQKKLALARSIAVKLVVSGGMTEGPSFAPRTLSVPFDTGVNHLWQIVPPEVYLVIGTICTPLKTQLQLCLL